GLVELDLEVAPEREVDLLAGEPLAEPYPLHLGHVPHQPEQGQARRRNGPAGQLLAGQAGALVEQRGALPVEERLQHRALGTGQRPFGPPSPVISTRTFGGTRIVTRDL